MLVNWERVDGDLKALPREPPKLEDATGDGLHVAVRLAQVALAISPLLLLRRLLNSFKP